MMETLEISRTLSTNPHASPLPETKKTTKIPSPWWLLILNCAFVAIGQVAGPLLLRLYFLHGGNSKWLTTWLQSAAFPMLLLPLSISTSKSSRPSKSLVAASAFLGLILAADSYLFAAGLSYLPASTSSLLMSTQTAFTAGFAFLVVKQKFSSYSVNAVVLMTLGSVVIGIHAKGDRPVGVSDGEYYLGFFMTLGAAGLFGFMLPAIEYTYAKICKVITFDLAMKLQFLASMFATLFSSVAMIINKDFQGISREASEYGLGARKYYMVVVSAAIAMQLLVIGNFGVIFCSTSLFSGVFLALLLPFQQIFAVIFFHEKFDAEKGMALALCLWGFTSYFYGEYKLMKKKRAATPVTPDTQTTPVTPDTQTQNIV